MLDRKGDFMDYYSGGNGDFNSNDINQDYKPSPGFSSMFQDNSNIILIIMAMVIVALIAGYLVYGINNEGSSSGPDTNSSLSSLEVIGGTLDPEFDPKTTEYTVWFDGDAGYITGDSNSISFSCKAASSKSKIDDCDKVIDMTNKDHTSHIIKVTAEDTGVTRYRLTIKRR